jgi:hypothetical protein
MAGRGADSSYSCSINQTKINNKFLSIDPSPHDTTTKIKAEYKIKLSLRAAARKPTSLCDTWNKKLYLIIVTNLFHQKWVKI